MSPRPGVRLATRPLHFFWVCDCSGSMSVDGKIDALNQGIRDALPVMINVAEDNPNASVLIHTLRFSHGAEWQMNSPSKLEEVCWNDLQADALQRPALDIIFMVDTSGSMGDEIASVKRSCLTFADRIINQGAEVRLGLIGFDIGGHRGKSSSTYKVHQLSRYTIGVWQLSDPRQFQSNIQSLSLSLFGGGGCYIANRDTVDMFPLVIQAFESSSNQRILVIISDEMGNSDGVTEITRQLSQAKIVTHVLGVAERSGAHESIAAGTGGQFWNILATKGAKDFSSLLDTVAETIAKEATRTLADGSLSSGTDMGTALIKVADQLKMPPMVDRAMPPVIVLLSDGQPTDDFEAGLQALMAQPWGKKAVRLAIAIGKDADLDVLQKFIGNAEIPPLQANNAGDLTQFIQWASTVGIKTSSAPVAGTRTGNGLATPLPIPTLTSASEVW